MRGICLESLNPGYALALEEVLLDALTPSEAGYFLLWRNAPCIIVGRHQNTAQEVNHELVRRYSLPVVRRISGGGAVYHDTGNLNFSCILPHTGQSDFATFTQPVADVLRSLGVDAVVGGRNDILLADGRKISGNAQTRRHGTLLHHGTLLINVDCDMLGAVLTGAPDAPNVSGKYHSKGVASIRRRVANIGEVLPHMPAQEILHALTDALMSRFATERGSVSHAQHCAATALATAKYATWEWNYGQSPAFTHTQKKRFAFGAVEQCFTVQRGRIVACKIYGDFFAERDIAALETSLCGLPYTHDALRTALDTLTDADMNAYFTHCEAAPVRDFLCGTLPA